MRDAEKADTLNKRIVNLVDNITYQTFIYTSRGLFEKDKLIFICQVTIQVRIQILYYDENVNFNNIVYTYYINFILNVFL